MTQWVYGFAKNKADGNAGMKNLLGGKGANLADMMNLGLPVPPGFTITTEVCNYYYAHNETYPKELEAQIYAAIAAIETDVALKFGDNQNPLLVSVRSGARVSMPGMMDTVLNLGLNDQTVQGLAKNSNNPRFAYDSYRRFIQMFSNVVLNIDHHDFEHILELKKNDCNVVRDVDLSAEDLQDIVTSYKKLVKESSGKDFPQDVKEQLFGAVGAVFASWMNDRAIFYRKLHTIPEEWGTAVTVQSMIFGNMGEDCATGVAFTRDPSKGTNLFYGEYLVNAQGEDVVAGIRTPQSLTIEGKEVNGSGLPAMEEVMPEVYQQLCDVRQKLERHYRDMQDIEFTVQKGKLWLLQTRNGKRTAAAAIKIAADMVSEGILSKEEALMRVDPLSLNQLLHPTLDPKATKKILTKGLPASPGAACGVVAFSAAEVERRVGMGETVILVRIETSPEDITGMHLSKGILTARGGMTSHAAVVARGMGRACVSGAGDVKVDYASHQMKIGGEVIKEGDLITIDGGTGEVMLGRVPTIEPDLSGDFAKIMEWADGARRMKVRTNAETPMDAKAARRFGAEGIGLCRTEHMFFEGDRITSMREMILAKDEAGRRTALNKLLPMQRSDFEELFTIMEGLPVTIRLLDPPLHEFLPHSEAEMIEVSKAAGVDVEMIRQLTNSLHEANPMLGHRGCRLAISYPEICEMQARAIFEAAANIYKKGQKPLVEIMVPFVLGKAELDMIKVTIDRVAAEVIAASGQKIDYITGTMIELPRAALKAGEIAETAEFFSFGTNDLTQTAMGLSRDDAASFLGTYQNKKLMAGDPFVSIDQDGVGELVEIAIERGRKTRSGIKLGVCGEHGGDPASIEFFNRVGLDYVSCSPYRVPIARLAAAQAALRDQKEVKLKKSA